MKSLMLLSGLTILSFVNCVDFCHKDCNGQSEYTDLNQIYKNAEKAYGDQMWHECVALFEDFLHLRNVRETILNNCQYECNSRAYELTVTHNIDGLQYLEGFINRGKCLKECWKKNNIKNPGDKIKDVYDSYKHLHTCYYQISKYQKAANVAFTLMLKYPENNQLEADYRLYLTKFSKTQNSDSESSINLLRPDFLEYYETGTEAYHNKDWNGTIVAMENTLKDYFYRDNMCRAKCEREFYDVDYSHNFIINFAQNSKTLLECKLGCPQQNDLYNDDVQFLINNLNYLQICYYHMENMHDAAAAVASILFIDPSHNDMIENKEMYKSLVKEEAFKVRDDIYMHYTRNKYEKYLINLRPSFEMKE